MRCDQCLRSELGQPSYDLAYEHRYTTAQLGLGRFLDEIELADGVTAVATTATCRNIKHEAAVSWME